MKSPSSGNNSGRHSKQANDPEAVPIGTSGRSNSGPPSGRNRSGNSGRHPMPDPAQDEPTVAYPNASASTSGTGMQRTGPHIPLTESAKGGDWFIWLVVSMLAGAVGVVLYMFLQQN